MLILGIESSCDETAAAVLEDGTRVLSNIVASQIEVHRQYGGVVPELASRHHLESIVPTVESALLEANRGKQHLDAIAVTQGPGLVGSLLVGLNYAKALSYVLGCPLIAVNHLEGHIFSVPLELARIEQDRGAQPRSDWDHLLPALALVVSGGHTSLYVVNGLWYRGKRQERYRLVGRTRDDAAGEAFDKVAKLLFLGYPGGPIIDRLFPRGDPGAVSLPATKISDRSLDFSFSGIKTAVLRQVQSAFQAESEFLRQHRNTPGFHDNLPQPVYDLLASFQSAVVETLFQTTFRAAEREFPKSILVSGGVACNRWLRERFSQGFGRVGIPVHFPSPLLSTDNAAMIAAAGYPKFLRGEFADLTLNADVNLKLA
ncbi:MAG: tRNA (adenosine(37)-N6)-threonylcarbamoyltransferase complex transferase subunit TsaD [Acidobacteriota bacterium]